MSPITGKRSRAIAAIATTLLMAGLLVVPVAAANPAIQVNDATDVVDANPGNGICETAAGNGVCTLRAAIMEANKLPGADRIQLAAATYTLTIPPVLEPTDVAGDLTIFEDLTIAGAGAGATIVQGSATSWQDAKSGIFNTVQPSSLTLRHLTVRRGHTPAGGAGLAHNGPGTAILDHVAFEDNHSINNSGGAVNSNGHLFVVETRFVGNAAGSGGAISISNDSFTIVGSTFIGNSATALGGAIELNHHSYANVLADSEFTGNLAGSGGGAIHLAGQPASESHLQVRNTTFSGNIGFASILAENLSKVTINNSTIAGTIGHGLAGHVSAANSIVAGSSSGACGFWAVPVTSLGNNVVDDATCTMLAGDIQGDPLIGGLAANGGATRTRALLPGSPAVDAGMNCETTDQRGVARPIDGNSDGWGICDIGAYEASTGTSLPPPPPPPSPTPTPTPSGSPTPSATPSATPSLPPSLPPSDDPSPMPSHVPTPSNDPGGGSAGEVAGGTGRGAPSVPDTSMSFRTGSPAAAMGAGLLMIGLALAASAAAERRRMPTPRP